MSLERMLWLVSLIAASPALAFDVGEETAIVLDGDVRALHATDIGGQPVLVALGSEQAWILDPRSGVTVRQFPLGGSSITEFDIDDDGRTELVGCGATGLWAFPWQGRYDGIKATLRTEPCSAIERLERGELRGLLVAFEDRVEHLSASTAGLGPGLLNAIPLDGESARLATDGAGSIAWGAAGSTGVTVLGPGGRREIATTGAISDVAWGPGGWTWTLPDTWEVVSEDGGAVPVPGADALLTADDGTSWVYGGGVATVLSADSTAAFSVPAEVFDAVRADLDADGCEDAAWASPSGITLQFGTCQTSPPPEVVVAPPPAPAPRLPPARRVTRKRRILGVEVPSFLGADQVRPGDPVGRQSHLVVGSGWAMGRSLGPVDFQLPFFPALAVTWESGGPRTRAFIGVDSAALFFWLRPDGGGGIHLVNATAGLSLGGPNLRIGPFATAGILNYGGGIRTVLAPWSSGGAYRGIEARLTWFAPATGEVMVLYVWSQPSRGRRTTSNERPVDSVSDEEESLARISAASKPPVRSGMPVCGRLTASVGMASALSSTRYSWNFVGSSAPVAFTGSPAVSLSCESGSAPGRVFESFIGMESAPFLRYFGTGDSVLHHFGTVSGGLMVGSDTLRAGPIGTAGIWVLGGGARVAAGLHTDRQGLRHVLELRSQMLYQGAPSGHFMLMYGVSFDPWKDPVFRER